MEEEAVPGFRVEQVLGSGAGGELWWAREEASGAPVVLQRLPDGPVLERWRAWTALGSPYVVGVREVLDVDPPVLVLDLPTVVPLGALLRQRGRLTAGEVITVGVPVARALAQAHAAGLVHGGPAPSSVLVAPSGMPLLGDPGTGEGTPAQDVRALVELCRQLLGASRPLGALDGPAELPDGVPDALAAVLEEAHADPPPAAELAQRLQAAHAAAPLRLTGSRPELGAPLPGSREWVAPVGRRRAHRAPRRRALPVALVLLVVVGIAGLVLRPSASPDWAAVVQELDRGRERAWAAADPGLLGAVYAPGAAASRVDAAALDRLRRQGRTAVGVRHRVVRVEPRAVTRERAELRVVDELAPQEVRDSRGRLLERRPGRGERAYDVVLVRTPGGWRLAEVAPA